MEVRPARDDDRQFVLETVKRLSAFGPPPWRSGDEIVEGESRTLRAFFDAPDPACRLLIAEAEVLLGFAFVEEVQDYFTLVRHGHVGILAVSDAAEGRGASRALIHAAEAWSRERGHRVLTLNVFEGNRHARDVYEHLGFVPETIKYVKRI
jgi:GNAT superfamily N-acetyltransferase